MQLGSGGSVREYGIFTLHLSGICLSPLSEIELMVIGFTMGYINFSKWDSGEWISHSLF